VECAPSHPVARLLRSIRPLQTRNHTGVRFLEAHELRLAFDLNAGFAQTLDQQTLVLVLGKNQRVRERAEARAQFPEDCPRRLPAGHPEIRGNGPVSTLDDGVSKADLAVQLERARLHG
jgi:hypothetical protein